MTTNDINRTKTELKIVGGILHVLVDRGLHSAGNDYVGALTNALKHAENLVESDRCEQWGFFTDLLHSARTELLGSVESYATWVALTDAMSPEEDIVVPERFVLVDEDEPLLDIDPLDFEVSDFLRGPNAPTFV